jgi:DNA-binding PadR family transcriptional regulator
MYMKDFILAELASSPLHGYELSRRYSDHRKKKFVASEVYASLHLLEAQGHITSSWEEGETAMRKVYRLSE